MEVDDELYIHGTPPDLASRPCNELLCQQYWFGGSLANPANVIYLRVDLVWHRLTFDYGDIFWSEQHERPEPEAIPEIGAEYRIDDLGGLLGVSGRLIHGYLMRPRPDGSEVEFQFDGGQNVTFRSTGEQTAIVT